jgi:hypothetical protein
MKDSLDNVSIASAPDTFRRSRQSASVSGRARLARVFKRQEALAKIGLFIASLMLSITIVSVLVLASIYRRYERRTLAFVDWVTASNRNLAVFVITIFAVPITLVLL